MALLEAFALVAALTVAAATPTPAPASVPEGVWGGTGIRVEVREGKAKIELDAAHGETDGPLVLDGSGAFDAAGAPEKGEPARFRGTLDGDVLTLTVTVGRDSVAAGPLQARRGALARLRKMY
jgi:hypothetical protein